MSETVSNPVIIQHTTIVEKEKETTVELLIADHRDPDEAKEWLDLQVVVPGALNPTFAAVQKAALHRARQIINERIQETEARSNQ